MKSFLEEVAEHLVNKYQQELGEVTVVFPNRRAGMFLKKHLSRKIQKPVWSPEVVSLEDFLFQFSKIQKADPLTLIFDLFQSFNKFQERKEGFETFYSWGEMLLRDFEEVDHYLVSPKNLFKHVKDDRQLTEDFYFLDEEQERIIQKFWQEFFPSATKTQEQFVETWKILANVYEDFKSQIKKKNYGYTSHIYRSINEQIDDLRIEQKKKLVFAGFNALTPVEEKLIKKLVEVFDADIIWDLDEYYLENEQQEAGQFLRSYQADSVFGPTFPKEIPARIEKSKEIQVTGVALEVGQAKQVGVEIEKLLANGSSLEEIVVILPQDYMLFPVLNALPSTVEKLNVTMGYPLKDTPLFGLLEAIIEVQENLQISPSNGISFYHKPTMDVLNHPYLYKEDQKPLDDLIKAIKSQNQIRVFQQDIAEIGSTLLQTIFRQPKEAESIAEYLLSVLDVLGQTVIERFGLEHEYLYQFKQALGKLNEILSAEKVLVDLKTFKQLFRKTCRTLKIPFSGEPVAGLQVMGAMESRNLDFKHVFMINMNEDIFPASQKTGSFIPYRIRKAFDLPTFEVQDAIFSYLFYRLFQRAESLSFYYNMYADFGMSGELSRFLRQISYESVHREKIVWNKLSSSISARERFPISIKKTNEVVKRLSIYTNQEPPEKRKRLSASALNTYFDCQLRFYFKYVLRLFSADEISDDLEARNFGNVLHRSLEFLYLNFMEKKGGRQIEIADVQELAKSIPQAIEEAFREEYGMTGKRSFEFKDRNVVMSEIITKFVTKIVAEDKSYAPFSIISLEKEDNYQRDITINLNNQKYEVRLGADIDRVDQTDEQVRVIDYKTGKDDRFFPSIESLFFDENQGKGKNKRNKAAFQTMLYAWLFAEKHGVEKVIAPGLVNMKDFFQSDFDYRLQFENKPLLDARPYLKQFEALLNQLIMEIFSSDQPFRQTEDTSKCLYCDFKSICGK